MVVRSITLWPVCPQEGFLPIFHGRLQLGDFPVINDDQCHSMSTFPASRIPKATLRLIPFTLMTFLWFVSRFVGEPGTCAEAPGRSSCAKTSHVAEFYKEPRPKYV